MTVDQNIFLKWLIKLEKRNIYGTIKNVDTKYIETIKSYITDSMEYIDKSLIYEVSENSSIFIDLNRYIINK